MKLKKILPALIVMVLGSWCMAQSPDYLDTRLSYERRAADLVSRMTLEEKADQMMHSAPAIQRLGLPAYNWWNEALHGIARSGTATVFPQAIGLGATFDPGLIYRVADAISDEARAMYHAAIKQGYHEQYGGLTFWSPNVNIFRDPRWGRGQETYGEDPFLTGQLGAAFVRGMQGDDPQYLKTAACAKHFVVHSGPEKLRHEFDAVVSEKDLNETYLPAFHSLVNAGVEAVMCAYNATDGEPCCANHRLLQDILVQSWGFKGHILSDCWAIADFYSRSGHHFSADAAEASAEAVRNGVVLNCGNSYGSLVDAVKRGLITETEIDHALSHLMVTRFKLGMFDTDENNPYAQIGPEVINSSAHRALALETAEKGIVLLKNNGVLPLRNDLPKYFITGPNAANVDALIGNYYGVNPEMVTFLEGISAAIAPGSQLQYRTGILLDRPNTNPADWTTGNAAGSDANFAVLGITGALEGEEGAAIASDHAGDMLEYIIPPHQIEFLRKLKQGHNKPVIAIITGGCPLNLSEVQEIADAVIMAWYPGEEGGHAVADILFGKVSPSGRLPVTFPKSLEQLPPYEDYNMAGRTYRYLEAEPLYPFGFGLSYTTFEYNNLKLSASEITPDGSTVASVTVKNSGAYPADEVVQVYIHDVMGSSPTPLFSLKGVKRIHLRPGEETTVQFAIGPEQLALVLNDGSQMVEPGDFKIYAGGCLPTQRSRELGMPGWQEATLKVE